MRELTLARGIATVLCGLGLCGFPSMAQETKEPEERLETVRLVAGEMQIVTTYKDDKKNAKVRFKGREFDLGYGGAVHHKTFRLVDREIVVIATFGDVRGMPPKYDIISIGPRGAAEHIKNTNFSTADATFIATQKGNVIYFILGYEDGLKKSAILSTEGLTVSMTKEFRAAIPKRDCKWLYEQALDDCVRNPDDFRPCDDVFHPMATERGFSSLEENPRWAVAKDRFALACKKACETKKRPAQAAFAKSICGP